MSQMRLWDHLLGLCPARPQRQPGPEPRVPRRRRRWERGESGGGSAASGLRPVVSPSLPWCSAQVSEVSSSLPSPPALYIPGCPPHPATTLEALLRFTGSI